jgi:cytosine/adenosine deaminase-related metal-dependent hydrolase
MLLLLLACNGPDDDKVRTDDTGHVDDTSDTDEPGSLVTLGPDLPECSPTSASGSSVALSGVLLLPEGPVAGALVYDSATGKITCAGADCDTTSSSVICTEGVIGPGLINAHDHMQYNLLPPWQHDELYEDRYEWRSDGDYWDYRTAYDAVEDDHGCAIMRLAETRNLVAGTNAVVGSLSDDCVAGGIRNLDEDWDLHGLDGFEMRYSARTVTDVDEGDADYYADELASGDLSCVADHVAEGVGGSVVHEAEHMIDIGATGRGFAWVHGTDSDLEELAWLSVTGTGLIWSPRSNLDLYAGTTSAELALRLGVPVAIGPDWTWSGSMSPQHELQCVDEYLTGTGMPLKDSVIHGFTTSSAAEILGLGDQLGSLKAGYAADIAVHTWSNTPYRAVIDADPQDVRLVIVDGKALYGDNELLEPLAADFSLCEELEVCGDTRSVCVREDSGDPSLQAVMAELEQALSSVQVDQPYAYTLEPLGLFACEEERASCNPAVITDGDADGDGVPDAQDRCPEVYDPEQQNHDDDAYGDRCDPCPLVPDSEDCRHASEDIDDDGVLNDADGCPVHYDPAQEDTDGDGHNDACDPCPETSNPGDAGCPTTVAVLQDEEHADHPPEGTSVTLSGLVVTGVYGTNGYFAQDPTLTEHAAIYVYKGSDSGVSVGDEVTVSGTYEEYYDLAEISSPETTVTGSGSVTVTTVSSCEVATGGSLAEAFESMLVQVVDVEVSDSNPDAPDDYGTFEVDGCLWVDDSLSDAHELHPEVGTTYSSITGVMNWSYSQRRILPRDASEVQ